MYKKLEKDALKMFRKGQHIEYVAELLWKKYKNLITEANFNDYMRSLEDNYNVIRFELMLG